MTKEPVSKKRKAIWDKSGGLCWYCGTTLPERGWHADHFEPLGRRPILINREYQKNESGRIVGFTEAEEKRPPSHPERDNLENLVPACQSCNTLKGMGSIEGFRRQIAQFINSLNRYTNQYKIAKKYGLVQEIDKPVTFWFERREGIYHDPGGTGQEHRIQLGAGIPDY
ncbi:HNH endonuclease [Cohnella sp.]|uniref:HNH endonuclease n=1 Tax=Cohnella sp. TaxID=1883426 RepID=UPI00356A8884